MDSDSWVNEIGAAIERVAGPEERRTAEETWAAHANHRELVVVVHGPYNSGKSSLIKRLLIEDGAQVPAELTVSGGPQTTAVARFRSDQVSYVDTPGTSASNLEHDAAAAAAVETADVLLLVTSHSTVGEDGEWIRSLADGTRHGTPGRRAFLDGSLILAVARFDEAANPLTAPSTYESRRAAKVQEVTEMLVRGGCADQVTIHVVCADLAGLVGGGPGATRTDYRTAGDWDGIPRLRADPGAALADDQLAKDWDGIARLRADLGALGARRDSLRSAARTRYWCHRGGQVARAAGAEVERLREVRAEATERAGVRSELVTRLDALDASAVAALGSSLDEMLQGLRGGADTGAEGPSTELESVLEKTLDAWNGRYVPKLRALAQEVETEFGYEQQRPLTPKFDAWLRELTSSKRPTGSGSGSGSEVQHTSARAQQFTDLAEGAIKGVYWLTQGVSVEQARGEIERAGQATSIEEYLRRSPRRRFSSEADLERARKLLPRVEAVVNAVQIAASGAPLVLGYLAERRAARQRSERDQALREQQRSVRESLEANVLDGEDGWRAAVHRLREELDGNRWLASLTTDARIAELEAAGDQLAELVTVTVPEPPG